MILIGLNIENNSENIGANGNFDIRHNSNWPIVAKGKEQELRKRSKFGNIKPTLPIIKNTPK